MTASSSRWARRLTALLFVLASAAQVDLAHGQAAPAQAAQAATQDQTQAGPDGAQRRAPGAAQNRQRPGGPGGFGENAAAPVRVDAVVSEAMSQTVPVLGRLVARRGGNVAARVAGAVAEVHVDVGDRVEKGAPLASLDRGWLSLRVDLGEAALKESEATIEREAAARAMAQLALDRLTQLRESAAFSSARFEDAQQELSQATGSLIAAQARVASALAQVRVARLDLLQADIRAPYDGVVTSRSAQPGDWLGIGDAVVAMVDDTTLEIEADVPGERVGALVQGAALRATLPGGEETRARLRAIIPEENAMTRTRAVRFAADFGEMEMPLAINQTVTVHIPVEAARMVVTVHKDAINQGPEGMSVFVVEDGTAQPRQVTLGTAVGPRFVVAGGLRPGDMVIVRGNERLQPGQKVSF